MHLCKAAEEPEVQLKASSDLPALQTFGSDSSLQLLSCGCSEVFFQTKLWEFFRLEDAAACGLLRFDDHPVVWLLLLLHSNRLCLQLLKNKAYLVLLLCFGSGIAVFTCFSTLLEQVLCVQGYTNVSWARTEPDLGRLECH